MRIIGRILLALAFGTSSVNAHDFDEKVTSDRLDYYLTELQRLEKNTEGMFEK